MKQEDPNVHKAQVIQTTFSGARCSVTKMTSREYRRLHNRMQAIDDSGCVSTPAQTLRTVYPRVTPAHLYASLRSLFGESDPCDDYKCSYAYHLLLKIARGPKRFEYLCRFCDWRGALDFEFARITRNRVLPVKTRMHYHKPYAKEFSSREMSYFQDWFVLYVAAHFDAVKHGSLKEFVRTRACDFTVYGLAAGKFFCRSFPDERSYERFGEKLLGRGMDFELNLP